MAGGLHSLTLKSLTSLSTYVLDHQPWPGYHGSLQTFWVRACLGQVPDLSFTRGQLYTQESLIQLCPTLPPTTSEQQEGGVVLGPEVAWG